MTGNSDSDDDNDLPTLEGLEEQRRRRRQVLLGVLFHLVIDRRRNRRPSTEQLEDQETTSNTTTTPSEPLRILSHEDALACEAVCRFCLEGPSCSTVVPLATSTSDEDENDDDATSTNDTNNEQSDHRDQQLVAPCRCSGGSEWVHVGCLRRWQRQALLTRDLRMAAQCNVCTAIYRLPPPPPPTLRTNMVKRGSYLISTEASGSGTTFHQKVVVLLHDLETSGTMSGLIINSHLTVRREVPSTLEASVPENLELMWRNGGPVCGGRFGLTRYVVAHTIRRSGQEQSEEEELVHSLPVFQDPTIEPEEALDESSNGNADNQNDLLRFISEASDSRSPATFRGAELPGVIQRLMQHDSGSGTDSSSPNMTRRRLILFAGYCKWGRGQLQNELQRGVWGICTSGELHDVLRHDVDGLYEEITNSERMLPRNQLMEQESE